MKTKVILIVAALVIVAVVYFKYLKNKKKTLDSIARDKSDLQLKVFKEVNRIGDKQALGQEITSDDISSLERVLGEVKASIPSLIEKKEKLNSSYAGDQYEGNELSEMLK